MDNFSKFSPLVRAQFDAMAKTGLFEVARADNNVLWDHYLASFPEGSDPVYRVRTEHDCSCCKSFIRGVAHVVSFKDGELVTIWDVEGAPYPYDVVAKAMAAKVRELAVNTIFMTPMRSFGAEVTRELMEDGTVKSWKHFSITIPRQFVSADHASHKSRAVASVGVFRRGMEELTHDALQTVIELIEARALYRGDQWLNQLKEFVAHKTAYTALNSASARAAYRWMNYKTPSAQIKNTSMGTLLEDLSKGTDIEAAVRKYEAMVAPQNYRRTTALITPKMVENAVAKLSELGLEDAVKRRHARMSDVSVNDVLFVDNEARPHMKDGLTDLLMGEVKRKPVNPKKATDIIADDFVANILPKAKAIDVVLTGRNKGNFMTLTAPESDSGRLFAWDNDFAWAYDGNVTDGLKERVKKAGGDVDADLRVSLGWYNYDDLDLHCLTPDGKHISFRNKAGILDVDMNAGGGTSRNAVENMRWKTMPRDGIYQIVVDNFAKRENKDYGFELEVECEGRVWSFKYDKPVGREVRVLRLTIKNRALVKVEATSDVQASEGVAASGDKWGVPYNAPVPVEAMMLSPNHWGENKNGQKHLFFVLRNCRNPEKVQGLFNEYLRPELREHRKVFEVLGSKTMIDPAEDQLSGVGFTAAREDIVTVVVNGGETYNVHF